MSRVCSFPARRAKSLAHVHHLLKYLCCLHFQPMYSCSGSHPRSSSKGTAEVPSTLSVSITFFSWIISTNWQRALTAPVLSIVLSPVSSRIHSASQVCSTSSLSLPCPQNVVPDMLLKYPWPRSLMLTYFQTQWTVLSSYLIKSSVCNSIGNSCS